MRKMMRYCKFFGGKDPEMIEGDVFKIVVKVPEFPDPASKATTLRPESRPELGLESGLKSIEQRILVALDGKELSKS